MNGSAGRNSETRAIVTGGAQGIGFAVAEALADEGCRALALIGRSQEKGDKAVAALKKSGVDAIFISADVAKVADCKRAVDTAIAHFGTVNALVNAAATSARGSLVETTPELFDTIFATNVRGPFFLMQGLVRHLLDTEAARLDREHPLDERTWRPGFSQRLFLLQRCDEHAHPKRGHGLSTQAHPLQRDLARLDGHARRRHRAEDMAWRPRRLAGKGRSDPALRPIGQAGATGRARSAIC